MTENNDILAAFRSDWNDMCEQRAEWLPKAFAAVAERDKLEREVIRLSEELRAALTCNENAKVYIEKLDFKAERDQLAAELAAAYEVADPDNETPWLSLRKRIMHIGEQAALLMSVNKFAQKYRDERDALRAELERTRPVVDAAKAYVSDGGKLADSGLVRQVMKFNAAAAKDTK